MLKCSESFVKCTTTYSISMLQRSGAYIMSFAALGKPRVEVKQFLSRNKERRTVMKAMFYINSHMRLHRKPEETEIIDEASSLRLIMPHQFKHLKRLLKFRRTNLFSLVSVSSLLMKSNFLIALESLWKV